MKKFENEHAKAQDREMPGLVKLRDLDSEDAVLTLVTLLRKRVATLSEAVVDVYSITNLDNEGGWFRHVLRDLIAKARFGWSSKDDFKGRVFDRRVLADIDRVGDLVLALRVDDRPTWWQTIKLAVRARYAMKAGWPVRVEDLRALASASFARELNEGDLGVHLEDGRVPVSLARRVLRELGVPGIDGESVEA